MAQVQFSQYFHAPIQKVFDTVTNHSLFNGLLPMVSVDVQKDGAGTDGVDSIRSIGIAGFKPLQEKVTVFEPPYRQEYTIIGVLSPLVKQHYGTLCFSEQGDNNEHTLLIWEIQLNLAVSILSQPVLNKVKNRVSHVLAETAKNLNV